jgi:ribosomal protein L37E
MKDFKIVCDICGRTAYGHLKHDTASSPGFRADWSVYRYENSDAENPLCAGICESCAEELDEVAIPVSDSTTGYWIIADKYKPIIKNRSRHITMECLCGRTYEGLYRRGIPNMLLVPTIIAHTGFPRAWRRQYHRHRKVFVHQCEGCIEDSRECNHNDI